MDKRLEQFIEEFKQSPQWATMVATVEDSPWHREENVAVHTEMVVQQFVENFAKMHTPTEQKIAILALLFHDTGKPEAEEVLDKKDGSGEKYRRYAGHEQHSAVTFQECYLTMPSLRELLTPREARAVRWIIEHHLPYGYKDKQKRQGLAIGTDKALMDAGCSGGLFFDCLRSDARGRISDGHEEKLQNVENWIAEFRKIDVTPVPGNREAPRMFILSGPSGSGKSTWVHERWNAENDEIISYDAIKLHFWMWKHNSVSSMIVPHGADVKEHYDLAWAYANANESEFQKFANDMIAHKMERVKKTGGDVYVDIVNASKKKRAKFVELGKQKKFHIVGVEFWNTFQVLFDRQATRPDKSVPWHALRQQVNAMCACWDGSEVHETVMVVEGQDV